MDLITGGETCYLELLTYTKLPMALLGSTDKGITTSQHTTPDPPLHPSRIL
jgi:hypothetical protein